MQELHSQGKPTFSSLRVPKRKNKPLEIKCTTVNSSLDPPLANSALGTAQSAMAAEHRAELLCVCKTQILRACEPKTL